MGITHLRFFYGQSDQIGAGTSFPTARENPEYYNGANAGIEDGDIYYLTGSQVAGVRIGSQWLMIQLQTL